MILQSCSSGMQKVSLDSGIPLINAVLPVTTMDQVKERASDNDYNKGIEAALAAIEFITWEKTFSNQL
jgi:6,7-dimethyl-8-ribityllumazine synthase